VRGELAGLEKMSCTKSGRYRVQPEEEDEEEEQEERERRKKKCRRQCGTVHVEWFQAVGARPSGKDRQEARLRSGR
jgi:hypothetical protein